MKKKLISVLIASYKEPKTIGRAIQSFLDEGMEDIEIIVVAPDEETLRAAGQYRKVKLVKEKFKAGKPSALNLGFKHINRKSDIVIFSDGDVFIAPGSLIKLIKHFRNEGVGAVSGRPVSLNSRSTKLGYWAYMLTNIADARRKRAVIKRKRFFCSGYLFAIRKSLFPNLPTELLSEDGYVSHYIYKKGYSIAYSPESVVFVNYPSTFSDWIKQKKRSAGGYNQIKKLINVEIRSFRSESFGILDFFRYISNAKEFFWFIALAAARIYLWLLIYRDINIRNKKREELWQRVESTK